jgi:hypothetical protein
MRKLTILSLTLAAIFCLSSLIPLATAEEKTKTSPSKTQSPVNQPANQSVNGITQAAVKAGALACTSRINQVANFLTAGSPDVGALMFLPPNNPDQQMISASMEIPMKDATSAYASASFAPNQANGCAGMYETVVYWPQKCSEVTNKNYSTLKKIGALSKNITVLDGGVTTKIFLMPAGTGCVSIKKEVIR